jgi:hypothetical protein
MVEMHKPPNVKVIDEICVGPLAFHRRCRLQRQDSVCYQVKRRPDLFTPDSLQHVNQKVG